MNFKRFFRTTYGAIKLQRINDFFQLFGGTLFFKVFSKFSKFFLKSLQKIAVHQFSFKDPKKSLNVF
jgi:hypothetical protein